MTEFPETKVLCYAALARRITLHALANSSFRPRAVLFCCRWLNLELGASIMEGIWPWNQQQSSCKLWMVEALGMRPPLQVVLLLLLSLALKPVFANPEGDALHSFRTNLNDPTGALQSWDATLVNPCTWFHITCDTDQSVTRVDLGNAQLSGPLAPQLGQLTNLQYLELYNNHINGIIPSELGNLTNLVSLDLYTNYFTGRIPDTLGQLSKLRFLRLNNNQLNGSIPASLTSVSALQVLDLSTNKLTGNVLSNGSFSLFTPISFANNSGLCGEAANKRCPNAPPFSPPPPFVPPPPTGREKKGKSSTIGAIAGGVAAGAALLFAAPAIGFAWLRRRKQHDPYFDVPAEEDPEVHLGQLKRFSLRELLIATDSFSQKNILGRGGFGKVYKGRLADGSLVAVKRLKEERTSGGELQFQTEVELISMAVHRNLLRLRGFCMTPTERLLVYPYMAHGSVASCLRGGVCSFTYQEIEHFSEGFSNLVGKGSTNHVYKGTLPNGTEVAVKRQKNMVANQIDIGRRFYGQVELLSRVHHPNLINLIGYCEEKNYRMLILQYAPNGTLYENLHGEEQLSWRQRMRIALGTAYGLYYLHHACNPSLFHGNLRSSNILLTDDYAAKISGLEKISGRGSELEEKFNNGTYHHIHRVESCKAGDVYAFGVLLLELVSGRQVTSQSGSEFVELAKHLIQSKDKMMDIADSSLTNFVPREFYSICQISQLCIQQDAAARPNMESVIPMLVQTLGIGSETVAPITNPTTLRGLEIF